MYRLAGCQSERKNAPPMNEPDSMRGQMAPDSSFEALPSKSLALVCVIHALPLGWAAVSLPWASGSWFLVVVGILALLHVGVAILALLQRKHALSVAWQLLSLYSLLLLFGVTCVIAGSALYLSELYRGIGQAVSGALFGIWGLFVLLTVPISVWGLSRTPWPRWAARLRGLRLAGGVILLACVVIFGATRAAAAEAAPSTTGEVEAALAPVVRSFSAGDTGAPASGESSLFHATPATCPAPVDAQRITLFVTHTSREGAATTSCLQANAPKELAIELGHLLEKRALPSSALKFDLIRAVHPLSRTHPLIDALKIRPALDGVCTKNSCFTPWQLVALDAFTQYRPLDSVRDASFGCSLSELANGLGSATPDREPLFRIETRSVLVREGKLVPFRRLRPERISTEGDAFSNAARSAERHIVAAQRKTGGFRYYLDPFRPSEGADDAINLPRQAGTTLVLCELGEGRATRRAVRQALAQLSEYERAGEGFSALSVARVRVQLGHSALPLAAFAACRPLAGAAHDQLIGKLSRLMLAMQREDGSFAPEFVLHEGRQRGAHTPLYAAGQAVLALVLVDGLSAASPDGPYPPRAVLSKAIRRAMTYYSRDYWPRALRPLFFLEENWHCLAARAALTSHRHDEYEQFCLDYVRFKERLILDESASVDPEHVGGYSLSNMLPPHSTPTAGFAEALAAAIVVKRARGLDVSADRARMTQVLRFLVRQQWTPEACFACAEGAEAVGGFSESSASPRIRIDYVQHAMAAFGHGLAALAQPTEGS